MWESFGNAVRRAGTAIGNQTTVDWVSKGRSLKRLGKSLGNQWMIDKGRQWQYGHLSPEQLFKQHPSAFLRTYAIESLLEAPDAARTSMRASTNRNFQLRVAPPQAVLSQFGPIEEAATGIRRAPRAYVHLVFPSRRTSTGRRMVRRSLARRFMPPFFPCARWDGMISTTCRLPETNVSASRHV